MASFSGDALVSNFLCLRATDILHGSFDSQDMLFDAMLKGFDLPEGLPKTLRKRMPDCEPYTLTYGGLGMSHIFVQSGHLTGILSWETAGFLPVWWKSVRASIGHGEEDTKWKSMLRERMEPYPEADEFYKDLYALGEELFRARFSHMDERKQQLLEASMEKRYRENV